jgi:DNA-binding transcriptional ArsR family regulator
MWLTNLAVAHIVLFNRRVEEVATMTDQLSKVFAAIADPTRRDIVARLAAGDATVGQLAAPYRMSVQAVSKHLKVLEEAGLVTRGRDAQRRPVHLEADVFDLMTAWIDRYRTQAEQRYRRLDALLAEMNRADNDGASQAPADSTRTHRTSQTAADGTRNDRASHAEHDDKRSNESSTESHRGSAS